MHMFHTPDAINDSRDDRGQTGQECHTYREIAAILTERDGTRVSPDQVEQVCRTAEAKLANALLANADVTPRLQSESITDRGLRLRNVRNARDHHRRSNT